MTRRCVDDEQFGQLSRRTGELMRRVDEGTVPFDRAMAGVQRITEGQDLMLGDPVTVIAGLDGLKRLVLEPDRPISSWRELLGITPDDWDNEHETLFAEPEEWEKGLSEVWFGVVRPGKDVRSLEVANLLFGRSLHGLTPRMNFALAKAERELVMPATMPAIGAARQSSDGNLRVSYLCVRGGRLWADIDWGGSDRWSGGCAFGGFRKF